MSFCKSCTTRNTCTKICPKVENYLQREQSKEGYSARHIRRKEIPYDNLGLDVATNETISRVLGRKKSDISMPKYED